MGNAISTVQYLADARLAAALRGDDGACYDLGVAYSTGTGGCDYDLVEAHKWFNLAAVAGHEAAQAARSEIAEDMSAREVAAAQAAARALLAQGRLRAA